ncbi:hypothetical protein D3C80_1602240 [compost metagenome]
MRHLVALTRGKTHNCTRQHIQSGMLPVLLTAAEQQLHAETDAQHRLAPGGSLLHDPVETACAQLLHRIAKRTDARQNNAVRCQNLLSYACHQTCIAESFHGFADAVQVAHAVIDNCNCHATALPS